MLNRLKYLCCVIALCFVCNLHAPQAYAMTVEQAYRAIPHTRTQFDPMRSNLDRETKIYLMNLFELTDIAVVMRVELESALMYDKTIDIRKYMRIYESILGEMEKLETPERLKRVPVYILEALRDQITFLQEWYSADENIRDSYTKYQQNELVRAANRSLVLAYKELLSRLPHESRYNKQSFFNHLCALDFI